jgi:hypothetical protein
VLLFFNAEVIRDVGFRYLYIGRSGHHAGLSSSRDAKSNCINRYTDDDDRRGDEMQQQEVRTNVKSETKSSHEKGLII